ncbi:MAG: DUF4249 domain-containing protein [Gemmatimonadaceae bacterium]
MIRRASITSHLMAWGAIASMLSLSACERVVDITVPDGPTLLVVTARLEAMQGAPAITQRVLLTTTDGYFANRASPAAIGATVEVVDDLGNVTPFTEGVGTPGVFSSTSLVPAVGRAYTLRVMWQGDTYVARDSVHPVAPIDSLWFRLRTTEIGPADGLRATVGFTDVADRRDYYMWDQIVDGVRLVTPDTSFYWRQVNSDDLLDGQVMPAVQPYGGIVVRSGQVVTLRQMSLSAATYRFYTALNEQASTGGSPFSVPAANLRGNVANVTTPTRRALGYFAASEVSERTRVVP